MLSTAPNSVPPFLALPTELRVEIYMHTDAFNRQSRNAWRCLLHTCKLIHSDMRHLLAHHGTLRVHISRASCRKAVLQKAPAFAIPSSKPPASDPDDVAASFAKYCLRFRTVVLELAVETQPFWHDAMRNRRLYFAWQLRAPEMWFEEYAPASDRTTERRVGRCVRASLFGARTESVSVPDVRVKFRFEVRNPFDPLPNPPVPDFYQYRGRVCAKLVHAAMAYELDMIREAGQRGVGRRALETGWTWHLSATRTELEQNEKNTAASA